MSEEGNSLDKNCGDVSRASQYALQVALQTMKERCVSLHQRLSLVEDENQQLRSKLHSEIKTNLNVSNDSERTELDKLRRQVSEMSRQNMQLNEHIALISTENDQLWWRLSKMSKDRNVDGAGDSKSGQNLIRSRTFTQHCPNPNLRHKISEVLSNQASEMSLEEVLLSPRESDETADAEEEEVVEQTHKCVLELKMIKKDLLKQNNDLATALVAIKRKLANHDNAQSEAKKRPETADKSLETDESITEMQGYFTQQKPIENIAKIEEKQPGAEHIDFLEQKRLADEQDKTCPLCGRIFNHSVSFDNFREHVETHFLDYTDLDASSEFNFEMVSHTVGNF